MSRPNLLKLFNNKLNDGDEAYSRTKNTVTVKHSSNLLVVQEDITVHDGIELTFRAPSNCQYISYLQVTGENYTFRDSENKPLDVVMQSGHCFDKNAYVSVVLDTTNHYAYIVNPGTNTYLEQKFHESKEYTDQSLAQASAYTNVQVSDLRDNLISTLPIDISDTVNISTEDNSFIVVVDKKFFIDPVSHIVTFTLEFGHAPVQYINIVVDTPYQTSHFAHLHMDAPIQGVWGAGLYAPSKLSPTQVIQVTYLGEGTPPENVNNNNMRVSGWYFTDSDIGGTGTLPDSPTISKDLFVITLSGDVSNLVGDKTYQEIADAESDNKIMVAKMLNYGITGYYSHYSPASGDILGHYVFTSPYYEGEAIQFTVYSDDTWEFSQPKVTVDYPITVTWDSTNKKYVADRTFSEVLQAILLKKNVYVLRGDHYYYLDSNYYYLGSDASSTYGKIDFKSISVFNDDKEVHEEIYSVQPGGIYYSSYVLPTTVHIATDNITDSDGNQTISTVNGETFTEILQLIEESNRLVVVRHADTNDFYYTDTFQFSDSSGTHTRVNFRCDTGDIKYTLTLREDNTWKLFYDVLQTSSITDNGGYFTTDTVEGALQEIGAEVQKRTPRVFYFENDTVNNTTQFMTAEDSAALKTALINHTPVMLIATTQGQQYCYLPVNCSPVPTADNINDPNTEFSYTFQTADNVYRAYVSCSGAGTPSIAVFQIIS